jgi:hypothetical protein
MTISSAGDNRRMVVILDRASSLYRAIQAASGLYNRTLGFCIIFNFAIPLWSVIL